ncbi:MAG: hypothetical protein PHV85_00485 [Desulfovibrionaceae bacterium]|nr:hypothetical protein [Desulfovibrionaceae bacterium]
MARKNSNKTAETNPKAQAGVVYVAKVDCFVAGHLYKANQKVPLPPGRRVPMALVEIMRADAQAQAGDPAAGPDQAQAQG